MGIDYSATAGYGVKVRDNLTEEGVNILEEKYEDDLDDFIDNELSSFDYDYIGCSYSGTSEQILILEDPIKNGNMDRYHKFVSELNKVKHLLEDVTPEWFCEVHVF